MWINFTRPREDTAHAEFSNCRGYDLHPRKDCSIAPDRHCTLQGERVNFLQRKRERCERRHCKAQGVDVRTLYDAPHMKSRKDFDRFFDKRSKDKLVELPQMLMVECSIRAQIASFTSHTKPEKSTRLTNLMPKTPYNQRRPVEKIERAQVHFRIVTSKFHPSLGNDGYAWIGILKKGSVCLCFEGRTAYRHYRSSTRQKLYNTLFLKREQGKRSQAASRAKVKSQIVHIYSF